MPVIPLLIAGSIYALAHVRRRWLVVIMALAMVYGVVIGARNISRPRALMVDSIPAVPGPGTFASAKITKLYNVFPDMKLVPGVTAPSTGDHARAIAWLAVTAVFVVLVLRLERPTPTQHAENDGDDDRHDNTCE